MDTTNTSPALGKWILTATIIASSMAFIDGTALNVALPALQRSLNVSGSELLWIVNSYALFLAALLLVGGALGDIYGRKRVFMLGILIFTVSSLACGLSVDGTQLILFRAIQGIGGALMVPGSLSIISALFPANKKGWAIGTWSMYSAFTTVIGPVMGGWLAGLGLWRYIFFINLPLGIISFLILWYKVPETKSAENKHLDIFGALFATLGLAAVTYGFIEAPRLTFMHWQIQLSLISGILFLVIFFVVEARGKHPMMPLKLFRSATFSGANLLTLLVYGALSAVLFFFPLNLIQVQGYSEEMAGFSMLPFAILIAGLARISGKWVDRVGFRIPLISGSIVTAIGFFLFSIPGLTQSPSDFWYAYLPPLILIGVGMGMLVVPLTTAVMSSVTDIYTGTASGINNTIARAASVLAVAIFGSFALTSFQHTVLSQTTELELTDGMLATLADETVKLAEARAPVSWDASLQEAVNRIIKLGFVETYRQICIISGGLTLASALITGIFIKKS